MLIKLFNKDTAEQNLCFFFVIIVCSFFFLHIISLLQQNVPELK
jgi:hypothetical protein